MSTIHHVRLQVLDWVPQRGFLTSDSCLAQICRNRTLKSKALRNSSVISARVPAQCRWVGGTEDEKDTARGEAHHDANNSILLWTSNRCLGVAVSIRPTCICVRRNHICMNMNMNMKWQDGWIGSINGAHLLTVAWYNRKPTFFSVRATKVCALMGTSGQSRASPPHCESSLCQVVHM